MRSQGPFFVRSFLSGNKLTPDLERGWEGEHELTAADVRAYADAKALADAQRAG